MLSPPAGEMMMDDDEVGLTALDWLKILAAAIFLVVVCTGMAVLFVYLMQFILSFVGWMIWGI